MSEKCKHINIPCNGETYGYCKTMLKSYQYLFKTVLFLTTLLLICTLCLQSIDFSLGKVVRIDFVVSKYFIACRTFPRGAVSSIKCMTDINFNRRLIWRDVIDGVR